MVEAGAGIGPPILRFLRPACEQVVEEIIQGGSNPAGVELLIGVVQDRPVPYQRRAR
jgi:hypothetical protein